MARNLLLTGVPRAGTTLCCSLLDRAPDTVALVEPMPVHMLPIESSEAVSAVRAFVVAARASLLQVGEAPGQQVDGRPPDNFFDDQRDVRGLRVRKVQLGTVKVHKPLSTDFTLVIKHNAAFAVMLPALVEDFDCLALVRNPLAVLASWNTVDLPVAQGRLPVAERLEPPLAAALDAEPDRLSRQLLLLDWLFRRFALVLPRAHILRYEDVIDSHGEILAEASGIRVPMSVLKNQNASRLYDPAACTEFAARLRADAGRWREFYGDIDIEMALATLTGES